MTNIFSQDENNWLNERISYKTVKGEKKEHVKCLIRDKNILLKPEERIRQLWLYRLVESYNYPTHRIRVEHPVTFGTDTSKAADIVIMDEDRPDTPLIMIEVKQEKRKDGKEQLESYCHATGAPIAMWSNGKTMEVWHRKDPNHFISIHRLPTADQTIEDVVNKPWYIQTLIDMEQERELAGSGGLTLRDLILDMENTVLANSGVDVFEEIFKLIFIKLYDEIYSYQHDQPLRFRSTNTATQVYGSLNTLFDKAKEKWPSVFPDDSTIALEPEHLQICVSYLEGWKLFNSNLDVIDDAFEYLMSKSLKGEKGQFFTPRWVIEMCVRMLNPQENESLIDPACGSSGFLIHSMFCVWYQILKDLGQGKDHSFSMKEKPLRCKEYVSKNVFGIDFDEKVVRVSRCLNLIAGDGETNVLYLNSLDWPSWKETTKSSQWSDIYGGGWSRLRKFRKDKQGDDYRQFQFDLCMANPPFAGEIKQSNMLSKYDLVRNKKGKTKAKMSRDILFVERNLDLLKPGGRMAIVLPQGRFNNPKNADLRSYISERCRIIAVVELHRNTFKPHTGIKTSVLFVQKWNDDPEAGALCPKKDDYNIFLATQQVESVNNAGKKNYVQENGVRVRDEQNHFIVSHDLYNHAGLTHDGVAEAFSVFAYEEKLSFAPSEKPQVNLPQSEKPLTYSAQFSDAFKVERLDAKYFSPHFIKFQETVVKQAQRVRTISEFSVKNTRGVQPEYVENGEVEVINSANILEDYLDYEGFESADISLWEKKEKARIQDGDILMYTTGAKIGRTAVYRRNGKVIASNHVNILRVKDEDPVYVAFVLNSDIGRMQTQRWCSGTGQAEIYPTDIGQFVIPFVSDETQKKIVEKLTEAEESRKLGSIKTREAKKTYEDTLLGEEQE